MKKPQPIKLYIPAPCHQDWDAMKRKADGRHCEHCKKTVVDFSNMADSQVYQFFRQNKDTHCGRFLNTQLQRDIVPLQTSSARVSRGNAFAAVITLVALNTVQVFGQKNNTQKQVITQVENSKEKQPKPKVTITGTLTGEDGMLLENAKVVFDSIATITDKDGRFSFEITNENADFHNLYFSHEGMISEVRSYHPAMGATTYQVTLSKPIPANNCTYTTGTPVQSFIAKDLPSLQIKKDGIILSKVNLEILTSVSIIMKYNPHLFVQIVTYADKPKQKQIAGKQIDIIEKYLVENMGINSERLSKKIKSEDYPINLIDFINIDPDEKEAQL